jgi:hypothetical protein
MEAGLTKNQAQSQTVEKMIELYDKNQGSLIEMLKAEVEGVRCKAAEIKSYMDNLFKAVTDKHCEISKAVDQLREMLDEQKRYEDFPLCERTKEALFVFDQLLSKCRQYGVDKETNSLKSVSFIMWALYARDSKQNANIFDFDPDEDSKTRNASNRKCV